MTTKPIAGQSDWELVSVAAPPKPATPKVSTVPESDWELIGVEQPKAAGTPPASPGPPIVVGPEAIQAHAKEHGLSYDDAAWDLQRRGIAPSAKAPIAFDPFASAGIPRPVATTPVPAPLRVTGPVPPGVLAGARAEIARQEGVPATAPPPGWKPPAERLTLPGAETEPPLTWTAIKGGVRELAKLPGMLGTVAGNIAAPIGRAIETAEVMPQVAVSGIPPVKVTPEGEAERKRLREEAAKGIPTPVELFAQSTTEDLTRVGMEAIPWMAGGALLGTGVAAAPLSRFGKQVANLIVSAGYTAPVATAAVQDAFRAYKIGKEKGFDSVEFAEASKPAGVSLGFTALGLYAVQKGYRSAKEQYFYDRAQDQANFLDAWRELDADAYDRAWKVWYDLGEEGQGTNFKERRQTFTDIWNNLHQQNIRAGRQAGATETTAATEPPRLPAAEAPPEAVAPAVPPRPARPIKPTPPETPPEIEAPVEPPRAPVEVSPAEAKAIAEQAGIVYGGSVPGIPGVLATRHQFIDPNNNGSFTIGADELTPEAVQAKLAESRAKPWVKPAEPAPEGVAERRLFDRREEAIAVLEERRQAGRRKGPFEGVQAGDRVATDRGTGTVEALQENPDFPGNGVVTVKLDSGEMHVALAKAVEPEAATPAVSSLDSQIREATARGESGAAVVGELLRNPEYRKMGTKKLQAMVDEAKTGKPPVTGTIIPEQGVLYGQRAVQGAEGEVPPVPEPRAPSNRVASGETTTVRIPGEAVKFKAEYAVRELSDVQASHDPFSFQPNPSYHYVNDRDYSDPRNKERVVVNSLPARFDPGYLVTDNPDATNGPPIIESDGNVLGGNSRMMILSRVYRSSPEAAEAYKAKLVNRAATFGLDPEAIKAMKRPVLVRKIVESDLNPQRLITDLNKVGTAELTAAERATADARRLPTAAAEYISGVLENAGPDATLNQALSGKYGPAILNKLVDAGVLTMQEKPELLDNAGNLTPQGKERISKMFLGELFRDSEQYQRTDPSLRNKLERIVVPVEQTGRRPEWDLRQPLREAVDLLEYARGHNLKNLDDALNQTAMFGAVPEVSGRGIALAKFIRANSPRHITEAFREYARDSQAVSLFGVESPDNSFNRTFGVPSTQTPATGKRVASGEVAPGPGARTAATERPATTPLAQLTKTISGVRGQAAPSRITEAVREQVTGAAESVKRGMSTVAAAGRTLWDKYASPPKWDSFLKVLGEWKFQQTKNENEIRRMVKAFEKAVPDKSRRRAISRFVEAQGEVERRIADGVLPINTDRAQATQDILHEWADASVGTLKHVYEQAASLTPEEQTIAANVITAQDDMLQQAIDRGYLEGGVEGYMLHAWRRPNPFTRKVSAGFALSRLPVNPSFAKKRVFATLFEGEQAGYRSVDDDAAFLVAMRQSEFARAEAARAFVAGLFKEKAADGTPIVNVSGAYIPITEGEAQTGYLVKPMAKAGASTADGRPYKVFDHPSMKKWKWVGEDDQGRPIFALGDALVHPDYYKRLNAALGRSAVRENIVGRTMLKASSVFKHTMLLGPFHQVHVGEHGIFHLANAFNPPEIEMADPVDDPNHQLYRDLGLGRRDWKKPIPLAILLPALKNPDPAIAGRARAAVVAELVKHGMVVGAEYGALSEFSEGLHGGGLLTYIPGIGKYVQQYEDYLFGHDGYIPRLKAEMGVGATGRNHKRYAGKLTDDQILSMTADQANAAFGEQNYAKLGRNPTTQDLLRLIMLAPDFLEARARFAGQALKPYGREQSDALLRSIFVMAGLALVLTWLLDEAGIDAKWNYRRPFSVIVNNREYTSRSVVGDAMHLVADWQNFVNVRLNPMTTRTAMELLTGRDRFGHKRTLIEQAKDIPRTAAPIPIQGFLNRADARWWESVLSSVGIPVRKYRTPAGQLAYEKARDMMPLGEGTESQQQANRLAREYTDKLRNKQATAEDVWKLKRAGKLTTQQAARIIKSAKVSDLEREFMRLRLPDALDVWKEANPEERKMLRPHLREKSARTIPNYLPAEREKLRARVRAALAQ